MKIFSIANHGSRRFQSAFTMMEIAISLAVIGIALVAIIGILPVGLRTQRENRERTLINQDVSVFMELVRNGMSTNAPATDLTNYVFAITNYWYFANAADPSKNRPGYDGYTIYGSEIQRPYAPSSPTVQYYLTNNYVILGLMSMPEFTDVNGVPVPTWIPDFPGGCYSNHVVVYVHSLSGLALEKPPQGNSILIQSSFSYRILCENLPSVFLFPTNWQGQFYPAGTRVWTNIDGRITYWRARVDIDDSTNPPFAPQSTSPVWVHDGYAQTMANDTHELRLTFFWPLLPNNNLPPMPAHQTFRTLVAGQLVQTNIPAESRIPLYFFQPQIFTNTP